jgi:hypothetical protein
MQKTTLFVLALISAFALATSASPALAQDATTYQYGTEPPPEGATVVAEGTIQKQGITSYQYGTHVLLDGGDDLLFALQSETIALDEYAGERVQVRGTRVPGYQDGAVEGGPDLLNVTGVDARSAEQPPTKDTGGPGVSPPEAGDPGSDDIGDDGSASAGVLPDTSGTPVPWLLTVATLISGALLIRRIVR